MGSASESSAIGIVERPQHNMSRGQPSIALYPNLGTRNGQSGRDPGQADRVPERRASLGAGHPADRQSPVDDGIAFSRNDAVEHLETDQPLPERLFLRSQQRRAADEVFLVELDGPPHVGLERIRERVRIVARDDVQLLEPQNALRLDAKWGNAEIAAGIKQRIPQMLAVLGGKMQLVADLSDKTDPHEQHRYPSDAAMGRVQVPKGLGGEIDVAQPLQQLT